MSTALALAPTSVFLLRQHRHSRIAPQLRHTRALVIPIRQLATSSNDDNSNRPPSNLTTLPSTAQEAVAPSVKLANGGRRAKRRGFLRNPVAGTVHLLADVVDVGRSAIVGSVKGGTHVAVTTLDSVSDTVVPKLPKVFDVPVPKFVQSTVDGIAGTSRVANSTVGFGVKVVENIGKHVGTAVGNLVLPKASAAVDNSDNAEVDDENDESDEGAGFIADTSFAVKRLFGSTTSTIADSLRAVDEATDSILASTKRNSEAMVRQTFGNDSAKLVSSAVDITANNVKSFKTLKTLSATVTSPHSAIGIAQKSAVKAALDTRRPAQEQRAQPWQPSPQFDDGAEVTPTVTVTTTTTRRNNNSKDER